MESVDNILMNLEVDSSTIELEHRFNKYVIYHYTSPLGLKGIVKENGCATLWFTQYNSLNDISERKDLLNFVHGYCDFRVKENKFSNKFSSLVKAIKLDDEILVTVKGAPYNGIETSSLLREQSDTYLCCFSQHDDLLAMWHYYSKSSRYEGYSIGFKRPNFSDGYNKGYHLSICKVIYENNQKVQILDKFLLPLAQIYEKTNPEQQSRISCIIHQLFNQLQFLFKDEHFYHEQEVRAILRIPRQFREKGIVIEGKQEVSPRTYRIANGIFVPYVELNLPQHSLYTIKIAPLLERDLAINNLKDMLHFLGHPSVDVLPSNIPIRF